MLKTEAFDFLGQRTDIFYGNGSKTRYDYDPKTFRLTRLLTSRNAGSDILQDLNYTGVCPEVNFGNPVGNIAEMVDNAQQTHYISNTVITPKGKYTYNSLYRLLKATGSELTGHRLGAADFKTMRRDSCGSGGESLPARDMSQDKISPSTR